MTKARWTVFLSLLVTALSGVAEEMALDILPAEHKRMTDAETGSELLFLTTNPAHDQNLYYEQRSWLADSSMILLNSSRDQGGLMGYLTATGELVRLTTPTGGLGGATAAVNRMAVFAFRGSDLVELALRIEASDAPDRLPSKVYATERVLCALAEHQRPNTSLTENADGSLVAFGAGGRVSNGDASEAMVIVVDVDTGEMREIYKAPGMSFNGHVVFSRHNPHLLSFGDSDSWITVLDARTGERVWRHKMVEGEFCTHHCWWVGDTITYCGGYHPQSTEDADVKVIDIRTGVNRILGKGAWWPSATPSELAKWNWWHACGHEGGRWVAADNWHGDIGIFHAMTTKTYWLTRGHRTYGRGTHPEVGWDRRGEQVIFASHMLGNVDVCVATLPKAWQDEWETQVSAPVAAPEGR